MQYYDNHKSIASIGIKMGIPSQSAWMIAISA
jgi:hypothetical protein